MEPSGLALPLIQKGPKARDPSVFPQSPNAQKSSKKQAIVGKGDLFFLF